MNKKVLVLYYTQSGQLEQIVERLTIPFQEAGILVEKIRVKPKNDFTFPWTGKRFFEAMPESVLTIPTELENFRLKEEAYDLIILAYQPWFLSPSIPANSILHTPEIKKILGGTPVVTVIGARNMWLNAQEKIKRTLKETRAKLVGNIVLTDKNSNLASAVSILRWMLKGTKERYLGIFPKPGVSDKDISDSKVFGEIVLEALLKEDWNGLQEKLVALKAVEVKSNLMFIESRAGKLFLLWANLIIKRKNRAFWLTVFKYYLFIALFLVAPIVLFINTIFFRPFTGEIIKKKKQYYLGLN